MATKSVKASTTPTSSVQSTERRFTLWHLSLALVVIGIFISGYLSYVKLTDVPMVCVGGGVFNCETVQNSAYSRLFGIPIAWLGFGVYLLLAALLLLERRVEFLQVYGRIIIFGVALFAWLYSMFLVYIQFGVLQALCMWCLAHELNFTIFFITTCLRLRNQFVGND